MMMLIKKNDPLRVNFFLMNLSWCCTLQGFSLPQHRLKHYSIYGTDYIEIKDPEGQRIKMSR